MRGQYFFAICKKPFNNSFKLPISRKVPYIHSALVKKLVPQNYHSSCVMVMKIIHFQVLPLTLSAHRQQRSSKRVN